MPDLDRNQFDQVALIIKTAEQSTDGIAGIGLRGALLAMVNHWAEHIAQGHAASAIVRSDLMELTASLREAGQTLVTELEMLERKPTDPAHDKRSVPVNGVPPNPAADSNIEKLSDGLLDLKRRGLTFADCIRGFAADSDDPFVAVARRQEDDDLEIDEHTVVSPSDDGAWVMAWIYVSNGELASPTHSEVLEHVVNAARRGISQGIVTSEPERSRLVAEADWLEELVSNFPDDLDRLDEEVVAADAESMPIRWRDRQHRHWSFNASGALTDLVDLACKAGVRADIETAARALCRAHGATLDRIITTFHVRMHEL